MMLSSHNQTNKQKGDLYEIQIRNLLQQANPNHYVWLWKDAPEQELRNSRFLGSWNEYRLLRKTNKINGLPDLGGDLLLRINDTYYLIQCKNYGDANSVRIEDLAGFFMLMSYNSSLEGIVYYNSKLSSNLNVYKMDDRITYIHETYIPPTDVSTVDQVSDNIDNTFTNLLDNMHDYQRQAYSQLQGKHRSILQLPCGMGKTLISMKVASEYDFIIILSPLKEYCQQNLECFKNEKAFREYSALVVDSEGTRDVSAIRSFIDNNQKYILSITFKSVDILNEFINEIDNQRLIVIMDEFHNISQNDVLEDYVDESSEDTKNEQTPIHKLLFNMNIKILFMSATPRIFDTDDYFNTEIFGNVEYIYEMGDAIRNKYICDYELMVPDIYQNVEEMTKEIRTEIQIDHINDDIVKKIHFLIRGCLETGSRKCIGYFQTQEDAHTFKNNLSKMNEYYYLDLFVETILSDDTRKQRNDKIMNFKNWNGIAVLCSVKILDECINIPACDSIFMANPTDSKIRNIQRISRANRLDQNNPHKKSNIFIWADEYDDIVQTIQHLKEYDQSFTTEKIKILNSSKTGKCINAKDNEKDIKTTNELIDLVVGIKKMGNWFENWEIKIKQLEEYVLKNNCLPSQSSKIKEIKKMGQWVSLQHQNYKQKRHAMRNEIIYNLWTQFCKKYKELFQNNYENWETNFQQLKQYVLEHHCFPSSISKDDKIKKLGQWLSTQNQKYKNRKEIMKNQIIYDLWTEFREQYPVLFQSNEENWKMNLQQLEQYVIEHNCLPSRNSADNEIKKMGKWVCTQIQNYKNRKEIMKNQIIYDLWTNFRERYYKLFLSNDEIWMNNFNKLVCYILQHNCLPSCHSKDSDIKTLGCWITTQNQNYKKKQRTMQNEIIYKQWTEFREQYRTLFLSNDELWDITMEKLECYVSQHGCLPSRNSHDNEIKKMGHWVSLQNQNYKTRKQAMKNEKNYDTWTKFINNIHK